MAFAASAIQILLLVDWGLHQGRSGFRSGPEVRVPSMTGISVCTLDVHAVAWDVFV